MSANYEVLIGLAQQRLRKCGFEEFRELLQACQQEDVEKSGELTQNQIHCIFRAHRMPLPDDLLQSAVEL
ncbi:unnamed protein product [Protopolystoma xenopodis]|uniref:EF-hand domain-containing protein n=1 Tax=Protopolystoma xenopodis TaxID=117903 RepID=A0A3S5AAX6_9PLAT|nr:unnamed protein product [Protopolystoma xenopodis]